MARRNKAPICPYCGAQSVFYKSSQGFYRKDYGPVYACKPCGSLVGVHKGTRRPMGVPADKKL